MKKLVIAIAVIVGVAAIAGIGYFGYKYIQEGGKNIIILNDKRCKDCNADRLKTSLTKIFPKAKIEMVDYSEQSGKSLYDAEKLEKLPAVLISKKLKKDSGYERVSRFVTEGQQYNVLKAGGSFDPKAEICDNQLDDDGDSLIDCADDGCKGAWECMEKKDKPTVDLFVMSHCPFGTQIEKGMLPVWDLLGDKVELNVRFCNYAMHGEKEIEEELNQYCVQKNAPKQYKKYLECFLKDSKSDPCLKAAKIDKKKITPCVKATDKQFNITKNFKDKATWSGGRFPSFLVDDELNKKYDIKGSPGLVINGVVAKTGRNPQALLDAVCTGFKTRPKECDQKLSAENPSPGFGEKKATGKEQPGMPGKPATQPSDKGSCGS